jgi:hypothetical protein
MPRQRRAAAKTKAKKSPAQAGTTDAIAALVDASAQALALPIEPAWREGVRFNLQLILTHAARVAEFPLPDDSEPAPVFRA